MSPNISQCGKRPLEVEEILQKRQCVNSQHETLRLEKKQKDKEEDELKKAQTELLLKFEKDKKELLLKFEKDKKELLLKFENLKKKDTAIQAKSNAILEKEKEIERL